MGADAASALGWAGPRLILIPTAGSLDLATSIPALLIPGPEASSLICVTTRTSAPGATPLVQGVLCQ